MVDEGDRRGQRRWRFALLFAAALVAAIALQPLRQGQLPNLLGQVPEQILGESAPGTSGVRLGDANVAIGGGGYVTGIYFHPQVPDLAYIRTDVGGFYRWEAGDRWVPITDHFTLDQRNFYGGEALALDPNNPDVVYIAAGKYLWDKSGSLFKSTDRGQTWTQLPLELPIGGNEPRRWVGERLVVNPHNSNEVWFGSRSNGLWRSSNGGQTWQAVENFPGEPDDEVGISAIAFDPAQAGRLFVNAFEDGVYESVNGGQTWQRLSSGPRRVRQMVVDGRGTLYVTSEEDWGVARYRDRWQAITPPKAKKEAVFNGISLSPHNPGELVVSLGETPRTAIFYSPDGGQTWQERTVETRSTVPWWTNFMRSQPAIASLRFDPWVPNRVWLTDWYGVWRTDDIRAEPSLWTNYVQGHEEIVTFALAAPPEGPLLLSGVADVDGFRHADLQRYPSSQLGLEKDKTAWQDTYSIAYSARQPLSLVRVGGNRWENRYGVALSADGGQTWQTRSLPSEAMPLRVAVSATDPSNFVVTLSDAQPVVTQDGGQTWQTVSGLPEGGNGPWNWSQSLAADAKEGGVFYYYADGTLYRSNDGGRSFLTLNDRLPKEWWHSLKAEPGQEKELWLSLNQKGLHRSLDGGATFQQISAVEQAYLFALGKAPQPGRPAALYLYGTVAGQPRMGIYQSLDQGQTWQPLGNPERPIGNEPNVMEASQQQFGLVFIGTNGRGIYYGDR